MYAKNHGALTSEKEEIYGFVINENIFLHLFSMFFMELEEKNIKKKVFSHFFLSNSFAKQFLNTTTKNWPPNKIFCFVKIIEPKYSF